MPETDNAPLADILQHRFSDESLLAAALTHPSTGGRDSRHRYERLEFLGDRVLGLSVAELLYRRFPDEKEGALSKRLVSLVRRETLAQVAEMLGLEQHLTFAASAKAEHGKARESMLADACEALLGALYLDGGLAPARGFVHRHWEPLLEAALTPPLDPKTALQERLQGRGAARPVYEVVSQEGPAHAPVFTVRVTAADGQTAAADGPNKRSAEQAAAALLLAGMEAADG